MDPDEIARICHELHECSDQRPGENPRNLPGTDDWQQARQTFLADIAELEDSWEHPQTDRRGESRAL